MVIEKRESLLLSSAALFMLLFAAALTLSPAARENSWSVAFRTSQWLVFGIWAGVFFVSQRLVARFAPDHDPYLLPLTAMLSGWGLLTISRLDSGLGIRQAGWLVIAMAASVLIARKGEVILGLLRRYKYVLLGAGLLLTALTLILGTNPTGAGPRLWLGCCGIYMQPSEPLKLLLVGYLAAFLADQASIRRGIVPLLLPTILVTGLAITLLLVQRDLGTASIFILLSTVMLYLATDKARVLLATATGLVVAVLVGYFFVDVVHARIDAWVDPWSDPSGRSYQIIQSLLAVANGGVMGRGPGLGSPTLVPVAQSDFVYAAISEETGLLGGIALLAAYALFLLRGVRIALRATDTYSRLLAAGLTSYNGIQTLVIIGGNLRILPLTGVTLPFVAYGGSSLMTSIVAASVLLVISAASQRRPAPLLTPRPFYTVAALLTAGLLTCAATQAWWSVLRSTALLTRSDNPRRYIAERYTKRGAILDRNSEPIDITVGESGGYRRTYAYPELGSVSGYTHPVFGQAGLEFSLDGYLRGLQGNPASLILWDQLLTGMPPPGVNVRLSIDLDLQRQADQALGASNGAVVLINATTGEIMAIASHPTYDPNQLDEIGPALLTQKDSPLLDRATQGTYRLGEATAPFLQAGDVPSTATADLTDLYRRLGFYAAPDLELPTASAMPPGELRALRVSPLQMATAAATLSNEGTRPAPRIATAVETNQSGWVVLPDHETPERVFPAANADATARLFTVAQTAFWEQSATVEEGNGYVTWYVAGTIPSWKGTPVAVAVLLESNDSRAVYVGRRVLEASLNP